MKFMNCKYFSLLALLCLLGSPIHANSSSRSDSFTGSECRTRCNDYVCGCNPLYCGALDFQVQAGVLPISWYDRGQFSRIQCGPVGVNPITSLFEIPKFKTFFKLPWTAGFQFGYALSDNVRIYYEFDYSQAKGKSEVLLRTAGVTPIGIVFNIGKYKMYDMYVGARYYFDRWCEKVSFYLGFKAGFVHHNRVRFSSTVTPPSPAIRLTDDVELLKRNTVPSGGIDFGLDICYCGNWSFILGGGVLASCGPKSNFNIIFNPTVAAFNNLLIGNIGAELRFPITAAIRYSF